ncbi:hypothetical protein CARUB_v10019342mg [Capsella rubella]|uniref:F-box domain-containing protein n=2 Tax=Capsella rubella TaxID=81985 RepID=R0HPU4_9BRAS|nr:hypothetical protein CARUB_v10019342mg [Capsella rubella]
MDVLPLYLLDDILFRLELKSLAMMRCTNKYFQSYISDDSDFQIAYFSMYKIKPILLNLHCCGDSCIICHPLVSSCDSMSVRHKDIELDYSYRCSIFGSCSGLLLLYINGTLFVANPLTKRFRIIDHSGSKLIPMLVKEDHKYGWDLLKEKITRTERAMCVGFAVNRRTTKNFKIVCVLEMGTLYGFEISDGCSWRLSETTINAGSKSDLTTRMKHVYLDDTLHWLRNDGSIIAFNPETEQARLIPSRFHRKQDMKLLFAADDKTNRLTLISGTKETISVYTLVKKSKWTLSKRISIVSMEDSTLVRWNMVAYDGKRLVVREMKHYTFLGFVHVFDMEANSWESLGSIWCAPNNYRDFYMFKPSLFSIEMDEQTKVLVASDDQRILYLTKVMGLIDITK